MGRVRQKYIKRTARELISRHKGMFSIDFDANREKLGAVLDVEGKFLRNRIAGYITRLMRQK